MSSNKETPIKTVGFVLVVCLVCAALVSISAVQLKPLQVANKLLDQQTKILEAANLLDVAGDDIVATYKKYVEAKMIDLDSGDFIEGDTLTLMNVVMHVTLLNQINLKMISLVLIVELIIALFTLYVMMQVALKRLFYLLLDLDYGI